MSETHMQMHELEYTSLSFLSNPNELRPCESSATFHVEGIGLEDQGSSAHSPYLSFQRLDDFRECLRWPTMAGWCGEAWPWW